MSRFRLVGREVHLAARGARRRVEPLRQHLELGLRVELRVQQLVELRGLDAEHGFALVDQPFVHHLDRHAQRGRGGALADACLQHEQPALLDGELGVAHVVVVAFEQLHHAQQLLVRLGEFVVHRLERLGDANTGHDVFALRVPQEVAVWLVLTRRRITRERHTGTRVVALVAEHHRLHVDRGSQVVGDALELAVVARALAVPRLEHGFDRVAQLLERVVGEVDPRVLAHDALEGGHEPREIVGAELGVDGETLRLHQIVQRVLEHVAGHVEHDLAEHLHEAPVGVVREALVAGLLREAAHGVVVEAEVEDGVHHPGHRERRARTHRHEQRIGCGAELFAHLRLERVTGGRDLVHQPGRERVAPGHVRVAGLGGDGEAGRNGQAEVGHLGEVRALAAEQELLLLAALFEGEDVLVGHEKSLRTALFRPQTTEVSPRRRTAIARCR